MKRKRIVFIRVAIISAILLAVCGTTVNTATPDSQSYLGALTYAPEAPSQVKAFEQPWQVNAAARYASETPGVVAQHNWPMLAANPQRTSWTPEEVPGQLQPIWYRPIEPYINYKVQVIAANGLLYISTARGLYAFDAENGDAVWVYPTELPLGHSPTVIGNVVYVGGYDRKIHAIDASTGERIPSWISYEAGAGFETNPLVVDGTIYAGNRDGYFYAFDATTGNLEWRHKTDGPILFSAAYQDNTIYFASNDSYAYALNAQTGEPVWKSAKLPGAGFHSYWPVVYKDWVIFAGSTPYRRVADNPDEWPDIGESWLHSLDSIEVYPNRGTDPRGTLVGPTGTEPGDWVTGTLTIDTSRPNVTENGSTKPITEYLEEKPWRRTYFVLNRLTGEELTLDSDNDGNPEYAPFLWMGTKGGNRYPPVIGSDGVLYLANNYMSDIWIPGGQVVGWKFGTQFISRVSGNWNAVDEPIAHSAGGDLIYWTRTVDRTAGAFDITVPYPGSGREWDYFSYNLDTLIPGYDQYYASPEDDRDYLRVYGGANGVYGTHGVLNPLVPYDGKLYMHRGNSVIAFGHTTADPVQLPLIETVNTQDSPPHTTTDQLKQKLAEEVENILNAGHLRPGYHLGGTWDRMASPFYRNGDYLSDYWHNPADTLYTLIRALPHLPIDLQQGTRSYLQQEFASYPPYNIAHIGWKDGVAREAFDTPPEIQENMNEFPPRTTSTNVYGGSAVFWSFPQDSFYGLWGYAQVFGGAGEILDQIRDKLEAPPSDSYLAERPHIHNAYIAGYIGYLELEKLAGEPESTDVSAELDRLMSLRAANFSKDSAFSGRDYMRTLNVARNFMYLVPELADYLHDNAYDAVQEAVNEYNDVAPGWFVSKYDATFAEGYSQHLYDYHSIFQAKALILKEPREELTKYLDVPAFERGDLFYIQNLIATIEATHSLEKTPSPISGNQDTVITYTLNFFGTGDTLTLTDTLPLGVSAPVNFELENTSVTPVYDNSQHDLTWSDTPPAGQEVTIRYAVTIFTSTPQMLVNVAELSEEGGETSTATAIVIANAHLTYLPLIFKDG